ncbi:hypothetical protein Daus18300_005082 [Diaporthe australafricana]|uniref:Rhodopsin domain-containing protein n=1 Tax=Diaporthe australafricana TaxID=127596 RepID=A0ABR3X514_9PEZI
MATTASSATPAPALPPPPGTTSNFDHPESLKGAINMAIGVSIPLTTIVFVLRMYVRIWIKGQWIGEDWLSLLAWIGTIAYSSTGAATMAHHGGEHQWDINRSQAKEAFYWFNVARVLYGITICMAKLAILCLYRRVFSVHRRSQFDITVIGLMVLLVLFYVATVIIKIFECLPRARIWDPSVPGHCIDMSMLLNVSGIFNTVTDLILVMMPFKVVWNLKLMTLKQKASVILAFTFGMCAPAFSLVGSVVRLRNTNDPDKTWVQPEIIMWGLAELTTGILCVCFPELGLLLKGEKRRPSVEASTGIREGRYRQQDAAFNGAHHNLLTLTTSLRTTRAMANASPGPGPGWNGGVTTMVTSTKGDDGAGGQCEHVELNEVKLIKRPAAAVIVEDGCPVQQSFGGSPIR